MLSVLASSSGAPQRLEIEQRHSPRLASRLVLNDHEASWSESSGQAVLSANVSLRSAASLIDYHPFGNGFRLTTGFFVPEHVVRIQGLPPLALERAISASATIRYTRAAPYLGLGWGGRFGAHERGAYSLDIGVMDHGVPDVDLSLGGPLYEILKQQYGAAAPAQLREEAEAWRDELARHRYYPVVSLMVGWRY